MQDEDFAGRGLQLLLTDNWRLTAANLMTVAFGKRFEPWVVAAEAAAK